MFAAVARCALLAVLIAPPVAAQAARRGTVRGADGLNVREQPSLDSPVIVALRRGRVVVVEKVLGEWALITLDSGRKGYVKAVFLELPAGSEVVAGATAAPPATRPPTPLPTAASAKLPASPPPAETPTGAAAGTQAEDMRGGLEREVALLRERLVALESAVVSTPAPAVALAAGRGDEPAAPGQSHPQEREPTRTVSVLLPSGSPPLAPEDIGPSLALAGVGVVIGFLLGAAYGRRQERNRRSRVRF
jgi:hypothetical protein